MDIRVCGLIILILCAICGTALAVQKIREHSINSTAWCAAFEQRGIDQNESERINWIAANNELHAQNELLRNENEQYRKTLAMAGIDDVAEFKKWLEGRK